MANIIIVYKYPSIDQSYIVPSAAHALRRRT